VNDIFLRAIPTLKESDSVLLVNIDDPSIEKVGIFPWTRDIMADAIVFLREMGADSVMFDLSYLDKSPVKVDPKYVKEELPGYLDYGFKQIDDSVSQVLDAFAQHQIKPSEAASWKEQILASNKAVKDSLDTSIAYVTRDVDAYFGQTLKFFGKSYLTLTMITPNSIIGADKTFDMSAYDVPYIEGNVALKNITAKHDTLTPTAVGITPALQSLLEKSHGAGFVNADPDDDGYRRRVHLLYMYNGKYYAQLALLAMLDRYGNPPVEVSNAFITLKGVRVGDKTKDIKIPRSEDGSVLLKWPKKEYKDYNAIPAWDLIRNNEHEAKFIKNLKAMNDSGFFGYWDQGDTPLELYSNAQYIRELLNDGEKPADGVTIDTYRQYRLQFLKAADGFLNGPYENRILADVGNDEATVKYVKDFFATARDQYTELVKMREVVAKKVAGACCIIGTTATSTTDEGLTTFQERFPNVGLYATVANMIISDDFVDDAPRIISVIIAFILAVSLGFGIKHLDTKQSMLVGLATLVLSVAALLVFYMITHRYIGVVVPFASVAATFITLSAVSFLTTIREKSFLRSAFSRYLSPAVINEIINDPSKLNLGGEKREMTAIFTDIRGFSTISEKLDPSDLVNLLNLYLTEMSNIVLENRGTIDKYEGDAIIAFFGAPIHMDEHAILACRTAIRMKKAEAELNKKILAENLSPTPLFTRIGINTGDMIVGNMGTPNKMDYTIMGNAVNLAARLEGVNKQYNTRGILISEHTRGQIYDKFLLRRLDRVRVVGVNTPLRLYELFDEMGSASEETIARVAKWEEAIDLYESKDFVKAREIFDAIAAADAEDLVAPLYSKRCGEFLETPPVAGWDGVFNLTQK
jgi:adenylate cyclase